MRRRKAKKIAILPDPKFGETQVTKFVNNLMLDGKKSIAFKIFYEAIDIVDGKVEDITGLDTWKKALENITPSVEVRSRRVGGATYQVPVELSYERQQSLAFRWIVTAARSRKGLRMEDALASEIVDAYNNTGSVVKKKEDTHKMAESNKAFAHFRW